MSMALPESRRSAGEQSLPPTQRRPEHAAEPEVLTTGQVAAALGLRSVNTVKRWVREGNLNGFRRGARILVLKESVARLQNDDGRSQRGGAVRSLTRTKVGDGKHPDVLSELRGLARSADRTERATMLARTLAEIRRRVSPALRRHGISRAFLFGSVARGDVHRRSDIDIAIELPKNSTWDLIDFVGLGLELEAALGRRVDLVNMATMKPRIRERVDGEQVSLL